MVGAVTGGILHTGDGGSGDRRDTSYRKSWEQRQEGQFIPETAGAAAGGILHTGDGGSGDRRDTSYRKSWEQRQEGQFIPETAAGYFIDGVITLHYWNNYDRTIAIK